MTGTPYAKFLLEGEALPAANGLIVPPFESTGEWSGVWAHEYFHFLQFAGTRTGRLLCFQFAFLGHAAGAFLREPPEWLQNTPVWRFPVLEWCTFEDDPALRGPLQKHFGFLLFVIETMKLYLGSLPALAKSNRWDPQQPWPWATLPPKGTILPELHLKDSRHPVYLGTLNIIESAAGIQGLRMEDAAIALNEGRIGFALSDRQRQILMSAPIRYSAGLRYLEDQTTLPKVLAPAATVLAADIALMSGIDELRGPARLSWEDWYPGWRFVAAARAIETLVVGHQWWPASEEELSQYVREIASICSWTHDTEATSPLYVFQDRPSKADTLRQQLAEEASELRKRCLSLWSVGPRERIVEASLNLFRPPVFKHYGEPTIRGGRPGLDRTAVAELWADAELQHIAWQLLGDAAPASPSRGIECFPWAKERTDRGCEESNGNCRWFPAKEGSPLPEACPMLRAIMHLAGPHWDRLAPMQIVGR